MIWLDDHQLVDRHFAGRGNPTRDRRLFQHLRTCAPCRDRYRTYSTLEALPPDGTDEARARLGRGVFPPPRRRALLGVGFSLVAACAVVLFVAVRPSDGFRARGGDGSGDNIAGRPALSIFRVAGDGVTRTQRAGSSIRAGEPLAFSFTNPPAAGYDHLMVFAVDGAGRVYWFWPAWTNPAVDPAATVISPGTEPMELGESVRHPLMPGRITIYGLFTNQELHVRQVEAALAKGSGGLDALGGHVWSETLDVTP
ncbi:MAG TPA: hypothetical protein VH374_05465 [Polyangia bacterium]|jgi:hypothetical protein|nr:hypothetical protein [Polyangia bacterium]